MVLQMNISEPEHQSFVEFVIVDDHLQSSEEFSNQDELISWTVTENNDPTNVIDVKQKEYVESCNVKLITKAANSWIKILRRYFEREDGMEDFLQNITEMENFRVKSS